MWLAAPRMRRGAATNSASKEALRRPATRPRRIAHIKQELEMDPLHLVAVVMFSGSFTGAVQTRPETLELLKPLPIACIGCGNGNGNGNIGINNGNLNGNANTGSGNGNGNGNGNGAPNQGVNGNYGFMNGGSGNVGAFNGLWKHKHDKWQ